MVTASGRKEQPPASTTGPTPSLQGLGRTIPAVAETAARRLWQAYPEAADRYGEPALVDAREELERTLRTAAVAEALDRPEILEQQTDWLAAVLLARGLPLEALEDAFQALADGLEAQAEAAAQALAARLREQADRLGQPGESGIHVPEGHPATPRLVEALLEGDARSARALVSEALVEAGSLAEVADTLILPAMYRIGRRWETGEITPADEHLATATLETVLAHHAGRRPGSQADLGRAVLACVEGCRHSLAPRLLSDVLEQAGWQVRYLGADVPASALVNHVKRWGPEVLFLSLSMPSHIAATHRTIEAVRSELGPQAPRIIVGGLVVNRFPGLWKQLEADGSAPDLRRALEAVA